MAVSQISVTEGSGKNIATHSISETTTKEVQRINLNTSAGVETGVAATPLQVSLANTAANSTAVKVDGSAVVQPASQSGTWTVQPGNTANTTAWKVDGSAVTQPVSIATNQPTGTVAHDGVDSGNPVKVGWKAVTSPKALTLVANSDRTDAYADSDGMLMVKLNTAFGDLVSERVSNTDGASTAFSNFSAVASTRNYVTAISVFNSSATAGYVDFRDGTGGSVLFTVALPAGGGAVLSSAFPLFRTTANTALAYDVSAALTTVYISMSGFQSKV